MRRPVMIAVLATVLVALTTAAGQAADGETWLDEGFEDGTDDIFNPEAWGMEELSAGHVGAGLRSVIPVGEHWGSSGHWYFDKNTGEEPEALYWRYYLKFPVGFTVTAPDRGKLPGPANLYTYNCLGNRVSTPAEPCWSARMLFGRDYSDDDGNYQDGPADKTVIGFYTYHLDGPTNRGDILPWSEDVATLDHGLWYCIEGYMDLNTPGLNDGVLMGWVDGVEAFSRSDFRWRRTTEDYLDIKSFWFDVYYGGENTPSKTLEIDFDSLALGPERIGCDDALVWDGTFADDDGSIFEADIEWLAAAGITAGCNPPANTNYCPTSSVTRGQMAAFLVRALDLPASSTDPFDDDDGTLFEADINALAASGITAGCAPDRFCPTSHVTRGQMAAFLHRALDGSLPLGTPEVFTDTASSQFVADIEWLSATGVTAGCGPTTFCPTNPVTRAQMAAFLHRALG